ncbi:MFS transporter [Sphingorhabdus sp. M41]|uniref:MFS transporter n=1 Tax=Sphingorhabdus sp. M41 TaxID=1806885 RepID=UPI000AE69979
MTGTDPIKTMDEGRMQTWQWLAVGMTIALNALDGFDVLSISFASPGIAKEWGVDQGTLGWVLSMELLGMAIGSVLLGGVADKYGRRPTILGCLVAMTLGMWFAGHADSVTELLIWRLITGLGIGGMLAAINATAAEFSNARWRSVAMSLMVIGYPIGGVTGGLVVQQLLADGSWRDIFAFGAYATAACIPLTWFLIPETPAFLDRKRPPGALEKINKTFRRFGHAAVSGFSPETEETAKQSVADIFKPAMLATTVLITFAYFAHITSFYFIIKWIPQIVVDMGYEPRAAAGILTWANVGGAVGGAAFGFIAMRVGLKLLTMITLVGTSILIVWFGQGADDLTRLAITVAVVGFFTNSAIVGLYTLFAKVFPTHVRATGTGFAIGVGRGGAALAPVLAGYLFLAGYGLQTVAIFMGMGSLLGAVALLLLKVRETD